MSTILKYIVIAGLIITTSLVIFLPESFLLLKFNLHAEKYMFLMLVLFLLFLVAKKKRLMLTSLFCTAALAFFLRSNFRDPFTRIQPIVTNTEENIEENEVLITILHVNLNKVENNFKELIAKIKSNNIDIISFQELTPTWHQVIQKEFKDIYPYLSFDPHIDLQGQALISKYRFSKLEETKYQNNGYFNYRINALGKEINIASVHLYPPLDKFAYNNLNSFLDSVEMKIHKNLEITTFCLGEFSLVPWSKEIQKLKIKCNLNDSRTDFMSSAQENWDMFDHVPVDYIFYNNAQCLKYTPFQLEGKRIGIKGIYRLK